MTEERISAAVQKAVKAASSLGANDLDFHRSLDANVSQSLDQCQRKLLDLLCSLLRFADGGDALELNDGEDVNNQWGSIVDIVDSLLEQTDSALDSLRLKDRRNGNDKAVQPAARQEKEPLPANLRNAQDLQHPQLKFKRKPDNTDDPWQPLLTNKPNAKLSLAESLERARFPDGGHPYAHEIETLDYPAFMFEKADPIMYKDADTTSATWVDNSVTLQAMLDALRSSQEIAVDLEHHDFHSFRGFVCLMQVSNRSQDWIVDTLALREELSVLNEVFTDPKILKVFHGANSDIIWLQRDFGLYIVNLFDTYHASVVLGLEGHGLAFLLSKYVHFEADKRYQLADWRIRPLPKEMLYYARSDTHFLLYIYDLMRNEVLEKEMEGDYSAMTTVLNASADVSLRQYSKEPYDAANGQGSEGWLFLMNKFYSTRSFGLEQIQVLKALHQWRDQKAREKDESTRFVMSNAAIVSIAAALPNDLNTLLQCAKQVSSTMQSNLKTILQLISSAIQYAKKEASLAETASANDVKQTPAKTVVTLRPSIKDVDMSQLDSYVSSHSTFWGVIGSSLPLQIVVSPLEDLRLTVPMPAMREDADESIPSEGIQEQQAKASSEPRDDIFIVRKVNIEQAAKRKSEALATSPDTSSLTPEDAATASRRLAKKAKKSARQSKQQQQQVQTQTSIPQTTAIHDSEQAAEAETEAPFDYAAQPSIIKDREMKKQKARKFGEFKGKIVRPKQPQQTSKQTTFKRN